MRALLPCRAHLIRLQKDLRINCDPSFYARTSPADLKLLSEFFALEKFSLYSNLPDVNLLINLGPAALTHLISYSETIVTFKLN